MLLKHGAEVNAAPGNEFALTALQAACATGNEELVDILLKHGADIHALPAQYGKTALTAALLGGHRTVVHLLLNFGADANQQAPLGWDPLQIAARWGHTDLVDRLVREGADVHCDFGTRALSIAVICDRYETVERLLELGVEVNRTIESSEVLPDGAPIQSIRSSKILRLLLHYGARINEPAGRNQGRTALQNVAAAGPIHLMEELIEKGADVHAPGSETGGVTALQAAACSTSLAKTKMLIERYGADPNEPRSAKEGYTTLEAACFYISGRTLIPFSQPTPLSSGESGDHELIEYLLDRGAKITSFTLHIATAWGHLPMARLLLQRGARVTDPPDNQCFHVRRCYNRRFGQTALETAELNGRIEVADFLKAWLSATET